MKNTFMVLVIALLCNANLFAQKITEDKVPAAVLSAFKARFTTAAKTSWEMENKNEYEAGFKQEPGASAPNDKPTILE